MEVVKVEKNEIEEMGRKIIRDEAGSIIYELKVILAKPEIGQVGGNNSMLSKEITIYISPRISLDERSLKYLEDYGIIGVVSDVVRHEVGHWEFPQFSGRGCPYDWFLAEKIFNSIYKVLRSKKAGDYVANMFMDVVDNTNVAFSLNQKERKYKGLAWFYYDQGKSAGKYTPLYDWFVRVQSHLWMGEEEKELLKPFFNDSSIGEKIDKLVDELFERLELKKNDYNLEILLDKERWEEQARVFAEIAAKLLPLGTPIEALSGGERYGEKSSLEKKIEDPSFMEKVIKKRYEEYQEMPSYVDKRKALSLLYKSLAKDIPLMVNYYSNHWSFPVVGYGRKDSEIPTRKIGVGENGKVKFYEPKYWWEMKIPVKKSKGGVPNIYIILDCSGSMMEPRGEPMPFVNWSRESKYHFALLGFYGIMNYLERMGYRPKIGLTAFSSSSRSKIVEWGNFGEIEEILFSPVFRETYLDINEIERVLNKLGKSVVIMLSDGEIHNWDEISERMKSIMKNNYSAFISIREKSSPFYELKSVAKVFYVEKPEDLPKLMIDFTRKTYGD